MPPANKRVKGQRISRMFIIGSEAWPLTPENRPADIPEDHTTGWRVYVKGMESGPDITTWLKKVQFKLFHTYSNPLRTIDNPPFEVKETGWGSFQVEIRLHFQPFTNEKPQWRTHFLQLEPYGTEEERQAQRDKGLVVSETVEIIEFNEPTEQLWDALTSEAQWDHLDKSAETGPNKGKGPTKPKPGSTTCQLPEKPTPTNPYSKQMEDWLIDVLKKGEIEVNRKLDEARAALTEQERMIADFVASGDFVPTPGRKK